MNNLYRLDESKKYAVPDHFKNFIQNVVEDRSQCSKSDKLILEIFSLDNDYIMVVVLTVAVECGFRLSSSTSGTFDIRELRSLKNLIKWRDFNRKVYHVDLCLPQLDDTKFVLVGVPVCLNFLIVNLLTLKRGVVNRSNAECIVPKQWLNIFQSSISERFSDLPSLAKILRSFFQTERDLALNSEGKCNPSLMGLPDVIKLHIFKYLNPRDFLNLTTTCAIMRSYTKNDIYWKYRLKIDFKSESDNAIDDYITKYCTNKVVSPSYPNFPEEFFPIMLQNRATSSTTISFMPPFL